MNRWLQGDEPARITAAITSLLALAGALGLSISDQMTAAIVAAVGAVLAVLSGEVIRAQVTPANRVDTVGNLEDIK